jgi:glycerophosphoryl diester phosphodiesterase
MLEIDVRCSSDGHLVLHHDASLHRTAGINGNVEDYTLEQLKQFDIGHHYRSQLEAYNAESNNDNNNNNDSMDQTNHLRIRRIPTLEQVFDEFKDVEDLVFFLDMKDINAIEPTLKLVEEKSLTERIIFGAVSPAINEQVRKRKPAHVPMTADFKSMLFMFLLSRWRLFWLYQHKHEIIGTIFSADLMAFLMNHQSLKARWASLVVRGLARILFGDDGRFVNARFVADAHKSGRRFMVFGLELNESKYIEEALGMGIDGIFSDRPDVLRATVDQWNKRQAVKLA